MIDSLLLWLFVWISKRWFGAVVFACDPDTDGTTSIFFFDSNEHAYSFMDLVEKEKLNHKLEKKDDY